MNNIKYLVLHHSGGTDANPLADSSNYTFGQCDADHKARFDFISTLGFYVGYHYFIEKNGAVLQARADSEEGAHCIGYNTQSLGICMAGNFDATMPTEAQVASLKELLKRKMKEYNIPLENIVPHRKFAQKTCYGRNLADDWAQLLVVEKEEVVPPPVINDSKNMNAVKSFVTGKRMKSLYWRTGMMILSAVIGGLLSNIDALAGYISPATIAMLGLILGEISKAINTSMSKELILTPEGVELK
jgi:hypothetical protein